MRSLKITLALAITFSFALISCEQVIIEEEIYIAPEVNLGELVEDYDLWYVDFHRTQGNGEIPFLTRAFTISFVGGVMYANNNISGIGVSGNGFGIDVGTYESDYDFIRTNHDIDGLYNFEIRKISQNEIKIYNPYTDTTHFLIGYNTNNFDYDKLFYENIEYLLQDFKVWSKISTSNTGQVNDFDNENHLQFTPENNTTFYSSESVSGTNVDNILWNYEGFYEVFDVVDYEDVKILTLNYEGGVKENFELTVLNDSTVELFHIDSKTTYTFEGFQFIQYLKGKPIKNKVKESVRKRTKIKRQKIYKSSY